MSKQCECGHAQGDHGERFAGKGQVRTLALGCKVTSCGCEYYKEKGDESNADGAILRKSRRAMTDIESQEWRDLCRRMKRYEQAFGVRYSRD